MSNKLKPSKCVCDAVKDSVTGLCPHGCEKFKRPGLRARTEDRQVRERARSAEVAAASVYGCFPQRYYRQSKKLRSR